MRIVFITGQFAPFQLELAKAVNAIRGVRYSVIFDQSENRRSDHWLKCSPELKSFATVVPGGAGASWLNDELEREEPDIVIAGGVRGARPAAGYRYRDRHRNRDIQVGLWLEPPNPQPNPVIRFARSLEYRMRLSAADFVLAIGPRTEKYYQRFNKKTYLVPYGEDLSLCFSAPAPRQPRDRVRFLFSGGLEQRHNFPQILEAFERLLSARGSCFEFVISGKGQMQSLLNETLAQKADLATLVRYDREFEQWPDRLRPFLDADVFVYPTDYAGWGLVIPEAMAAGAVVISSEGAEAAHYFLEDGKNGLIVKPDADSIFAAFLKCVDEPEWLDNAAIEARRAAYRGDAPHVAGLLVSAIQRARTK